MKNEVFLGDYHVEPKNVAHLKHLKVGISSDDLGLFADFLVKNNFNLIELLLKTWKSSRYSVIFKKGANFLCSELQFNLKRHFEYLLRNLQIQRTMQPLDTKASYQN